MGFRRVRFLLSLMVGFYHWTVFIRVLVALDGIRFIGEIWPSEVFFLLLSHVPIIVFTVITNILLYY